jgi:hypothetical protein
MLSDILLKIEFFLWSIRDGNNSGFNCHLASKIANSIDLLEADSSRIALTPDMRNSLKNLANTLKQHGITAD